MVLHVSFFPHIHIHLHCNKQRHRWLDHHIQTGLTTNRSLLGLTTDFDAIFHVYNCHPITSNVFRDSSTLWPPSLSSSLLLLLLATSTTCYHHSLAPYVGSISEAQRCFEIMSVFLLHFSHRFLSIHWPWGEIGRASRNFATRVTKAKKWKVLMRSEMHGNGSYQKGEVREI